MYGYDPDRNVRFAAAKNVVYRKPVIQKPLDAGFALHIFRRNLHLMWVLPAFALYELYEIL